ncbi:MAG: hypothetical protein KKE50_04365 [Nanoarchaeota archaeon]|nr:hypothetical protein [Nanoarchaeota archaeon]
MISKLRKKFKGKKPLEDNEKKGGIMAYNTYAEAVRNRRSDEITVYDPVTGRYKNVKIYPKRKKRVFFTW